MPQYDISTYISQIFWLFLCLVPIYLVLNYFLLPKFKNILHEREMETSEKRKEIERINLEISKIEEVIQNKIHESFEKIKKIREQKEIFINLKIKEELDSADETFANKKNEFTESINSFKSQISKNIDDGIINYSQLLIKKISSEEINKEELVQLFNNIRA